MVAKSTGIDVEQNYVTITLCIKCILIFNCRVLMIDCVGSVNYFCGLVGLDFKILRWVEFQKSTHVQLCVKRHLKLFFFFSRVWRLPSPRYFRCILSRDAMLAWYYCHSVSVRLSVRLSQAGIASKPVDRSSWLFGTKASFDLSYTM